MITIENYRSYIKVLKTVRYLLLIDTATFNIEFSEQKKT